MRIVSALQVEGERPPLDLGRKLGEGGIGAVHEDARNPGRAVKLFHDRAFAAQQEARIRAMVRNPPASAMMRLGAAYATQFAWPNGIVLRSRFIGFTMARIDTDDTDKLDGLASPILRQNLHYPEHLIYRLCTVLNLAKALAALHAAGWAMIDLKPPNVLVRKWRPGKQKRGAGTVVLVDCDSMAGHGFAAELATPDYIMPPALRAGDAFDLGVINAHLFAQDGFAFACIAFEILNDGLKPIDCKPLIGMSNAQSWRALDARTYAYGLGGQAHTRPAASSMHHWFSYELRRLFDATFLDPLNAPPMAAWVKELTRLAHPSQACAADRTHWKLGDECGQCAIARPHARARRKTMPMMHGAPQVPAFYAPPQQALPAHPRLPRQGAWPWVRGFWIVALGGLGVFAIETIRTVNMQALVEAAWSDKTDPALAPAANVPAQTSPPVYDYTYPSSKEPLYFEQQPAPPSVMLLEGEAPRYPERALARGRAGCVKLRFWVRADGRVDDIDTVAEYPEDFGFARAAKRAVRRWRFAPPRDAKGLPIELRAERVIYFTLTE